MRKTVKCKRRNAIHALLVLCFSSALLFSCKEIQYVPVERADTIYINNASIDTVILRDSVYVEKNGDELHTEKIRYIYKSNLVRDTVVQNVRVEVPVEVIKTVEVPKKLSLFDRIFITIGIVSASLLVIWLMHKFRHIKL